MIYRREIDGLRAVAVLSVMCFHAGFGWFGGGYVGVDVFFVISGYLITTIIVSERHGNKFSLVKFYERRARRILPALFFVVLVSMPFAWFWMVPYQLKDFAKSVLAVSTFCSNILFWRESGYFGAPFFLKPLLHTWSLGIEEQYYVLFPLAILAAWKLGIRKIVVLLASVSIVSLALAEWMAQRGIIVANFYLMPTRAWELLIGSLLAFYHLYGDRRRVGKLGDFGATLGLGMIAFSILAFEERTPFPGLLALVPTLGAALVIVYANEGTLANRFLSMRWLVGIGLISYSAYLWHHPLFAFARMMQPTPSHPEVLAVSLFFATLLLGWLTWKFVEKPFRFKSSFSRGQVFAGSIATTMLFALISIPVIVKNGVVERFPEKDRYLLSVNPTELGRYTEKKFRQLVRDGFEKGGSAQRVLVIGDSFAMDFINMGFENGFMGSAQVVTYPIAARCPKYIGSDDVRALYARAGEFYDATYCSRNSILAESVSLARSADVIVLAAGWRRWEAERILETIKAFGLRPEQSLIVFGRKWFGEGVTRSYLELSQEDRLRLKAKMPTIFTETNAIFKSKLPQATYIDVQSILCGDGDQCPVFTPVGELIAYDGTHLTPEGARYIGKLVFHDPLLNKLK